MSNLLQTKSRITSEQISGRNMELKLISNVLFDQRSVTSLLIINGPAGIGKTSLIRTALDSYNNAKCFKLYGKFENRQNIPYLGFRQAFISWSEQILLLADEEYDLLKENATSALQTNIAAVTGVFKELEVFFSRKNILDNHQVHSHQVKDRLYYFIKKFFRSITGLGYKLIFFLDDLQWSDKASLLLLEELVICNDVPGLLFITASRSADENSSKHLNKLEDLNSLPNVSIIFLKPLSRSSMDYIIPPEWNFSKQNLNQFKNYLWLETGGNPFQIKEILKVIQREKSSVKVDDPNFWTNLPRLGSAKNSVDFMRSQLHNLPFHQQKVIATASCLGYSFDANSLNKILKFPDKEISRHLSGLVKMQMLIKRKNTFIFTHDNIFSAANSLISSEEKCDLHQKMGLYFLQEINDREDHILFLAVNHLNSAYNLSGSGKAYSSEHLLLNIQAGRLALKNTAFETAYQYFSVAQKLFSEQNSSIEVQHQVLKENFGRDRMDLKTIRFFILFGFAETSFLFQKFEAALDYVQQILAMNCSRHQRLKATLLKMMICSALIYQKNNRLLLLDGIASLEEMLSHYGICIPEDREKIKRESAEDCQILIKKAADLNLHADFSKFINPDEEYQDLMNLITTSMTLMYFIDPYKDLYMVSKTLLLTLREGFAPLSPVLFAASFFTGFFSEESRDLAHFLGKLSLKMIEQEPFIRHSYMVHYIAALNFLPWENHFKFCIQKLEEGALQAMEAGDSHYVSFCKTIVRIKETFRGKNLIEHARDCAKVEKEYHVYFISGTDNAILSYLTGDREGFEEGNFQFPEEILVDSEQNLICRYNYLVAKEKLNYFANFFEAALATAEECDALEFVGTGYQLELEHFFFSSLSLLQCTFLNSGKLSEEVLKKVEPKLRELKRLSAFKSGNYLHKVYLIEAEIAKCSGDFEKASLLYDLAIDEAIEQEYIHHAAIAAERAFEYYKFKGRMKLAGFYLKQSLQFYCDWGAIAKVKQLERQNPGYIQDEKTTASSLLHTADFSAISDILQKTVPGRQISLQELGQYLVSLLRKEGNAKKTTILLLQENVWKLVATNPENIGMPGSPLSRLRNDLPVSILNYAIKKGNKIVLQDVSKDVLFSSDSYLKKENPFNITIFPVKQSGETVGLFYLENCLFSSETEKNLLLMILELASTTFANAIYYENNDNLNRALKLQERNRIEAVIESQEKERKRVAQELHDSLGQILALSKINLSRIHTENMDPENQKLINTITNLIDESCREVRAISHNLMPPDLVNTSLAEILKNLVHKNRLTNEICYEFNWHVSNEQLSTACKLTLYRVLQEILQNIIKHATANKVVISISQSGDYINMLVEDNGKGFDTKLLNLGLGLKNIYSRVKSLNGYLDIDSSINKGTVFNVSIPVKS